MKTFDGSGNKLLRIEPNMKQEGYGQGFKLLMDTDAEGNIERVLVQCDVRISVYAHGTQIFYFWINTGFLDETLQLTLNKMDLDKGFKDRKDKALPSDFRVRNLYRFFKIIGSSLIETLIAGRCVFLHV